MNLIWTQTKNDSTERTSCFQGSLFSLLGHIVSVHCVIGKDWAYFFQTTPFCFYTVVELSLFTSLINCWCNGNIFHKSLLDCADTLTHWKRTWLRTFWRLTLAPSLFLRLLLCSPVFLMKWERRMRIAWRRDCSTGELWEIDLQTVRDWIIAEEQLEVTSSLQTALVNNQNEGGECGEYAVLSR